MQPPTLIVTAELQCDTGGPLPRLVQFMFCSFPPKYRVLLLSPFIKVRSVDVPPHTKHSEPHQRNSVTVADPSGVCMVEQKRNMLAHAQKLDLVFQRNGRVHLYRRECQFSRLLAAEVCGSAVVMLDRPCPIQCTTAGYPLHSPFSPSLLHLCVSVCHQIPFLLYYNRSRPTRTPRKPVLN